MTAPAKAPDALLQGPVLPSLLKLAIPIVLAAYGRGDWKKTRLISGDDKAVAKLAEEAERENRCADVLCRK
jgi:hypothetical protein